MWKDRLISGADRDAFHVDDGRQNAWLTRLRDGAEPIRLDECLPRFERLQQ